MHARTQFESNNTWVLDTRVWLVRALYTHELH